MNEIGNVSMCDSFCQHHQPYKCRFEIPKVSISDRKVKGNYIHEKQQQLQRYNEGFCEK